jgi:hypothetical protein
MKKNLLKKAEKEFAGLSDHELLKEAKKMKTSSIYTAFLIGIFMGIIFYSMAKNTWGMLTLIPVFFIYKLATHSSNIKSQALENVLKERKIK